MPEPQAEFKPNGEPQFPSLDERRRKDFHYGKDGDKPLNLRLRRSISWLGRAEEFYYSDCQDLDLAFTCYWFAFNALYDKDPYSESYMDAITSFRVFFEAVIKHDDQRAIFDEIQRNFLEPIMRLRDNKYVFEPFWKHYNGVKRYEDWQDKLESAKKIVNEDIGNGKQNIHKVLCVLFDRLYVIRKQIVHGNAAWNSDRNRDQLRDGTSIMAFLIPLFITLIMNNLTIEMDLGKPYYTLPPGVQGVSPIKDN